MFAFVSLFAHFALSDYFELTDKTYRKYIGGRKPVVVKFYGIACPECYAHVTDFSRASTIFTDLVFAGINCDAWRQLCDEFTNLEPLVIQYFEPGQRRGQTIEKYDVYDEFIQTLTNLSGVKPRLNPPTRLTEIVKGQFNKFVQDMECGMVLFQQPNCYFCRHMQPQFAQLSATFFADRNVSIGVVKCQDDIDVCGTIGLYEDDDDGPFSGDDQYQDDPYSPYPYRRPFIRIRRKNEWIEYKEHRFLTTFVHTINKACGTNRRPDGLMSDWAGTISEADAIARNFTAADEKEPWKIGRAHV
jgi:thiol-disulfide isomerase/thioredoxin